MSLKEVVDMVGSNWSLILIAILSLVEVSKIKINPWSSLFKWIGSIIMAGQRKEMAAMNAKLDAVQEDLSNMKEKNLEDDAKDARTRILRCADEVYIGVRHSKEFFDCILDDITFYKSYCDAHPAFKNERTVLAVQRIEQVYQNCQDTHDFL